MVDALSGWWKVEYGGKTSYSAVLRNGTARKSQTAPRKPTDQAHGGASAYWFQDRNSITFAWKDSAEVEEWTISANDTVMTATLNDIPGKITKLF